MSEENLKNKLAQRLKPEILSKLREHQFPAIEFMQSKKICINADEMGLGKTAEALCALNKRGLVVCPAGLKDNWAAECKKFRPDLTPIVLKGKGAGVMPPRDGQLIITNVEILPDWLKPFPTRSGFKTSDKSLRAKEGRKAWEAEKEKHKLMLESYAQDFKYTTLIIDESHIYSNTETVRGKKLSKLASICGRVWAMSGTPMSMGSPIKLMEMLLVIGVFNRLFKNQREYLKLSGMKFVRKFNWVGYEQVSEPAPALGERLNEIMIRRKKEDVLDLPEKIIEYITVNIDSKKINEELEELNEKYGKQIFEDDSLPPFEAFSSVRSAIARARKRAMLDIVEIYEHANKPLIVFSSHRDGLEPLKDRDGWAYIDGATSQKLKSEIVSNQHKYKGLALTLKANHAGLNLVHFSDMLHIDLSWDETINQQSYDRIHRMGQKNKSRIMIMTSDNAMDMRINEKLSTARNNIDKIIDLKSEMESKQ